MRRSIKEDTPWKGKLLQQIKQKIKSRKKPLVTPIELDPAGFTAFGRVARETPASLGTPLVLNINSCETISTFEDSSIRELLVKY